MRMKQAFWNWLSRRLGINAIRAKQSDLVTELLNTKRGRDKMHRRLEVMEKLVSVGVDIHTESDSWVVMCIAGKPEYVEFFRLPKEELRFLQNTLREMNKRYGRMRVDVPPFARDILRITP